MGKVETVHRFGYVGPVKRSSYSIKVDGVLIARYVPCYKMLQRARGKGYTDSIGPMTFEEAKATALRFARRQHLTDLLKGRAK